MDMRESRQKTGHARDGALVPSSKVPNGCLQQRIQVLQAAPVVGNGVVLPDKDPEPRGVDLGPTLAHPGVEAARHPEPRELPAENVQVAEVEAALEAQILEGPATDGEVLQSGAGLEMQPPEQGERGPGEEIEERVPVVGDDAGEGQGLDGLEAPGHQRGRRQSEPRRVRLQSEGAQRPAVDHAAREIEVIAGDDLHLELHHVEPDRAADQRVQLRETQVRAELQGPETRGPVPHVQNPTDEIGHGPIVVEEMERIMGEGVKGGEVEIGEGGPQIPPSSRQDGRLGDGLDGKEEEDMVKNRVREIVDPVIAIHGELRSLFPKKLSSFRRSRFHYRTKRLSTGLIPLWHTINQYFFIIIFFFSSSFVAYQEKIIFFVRFSPGFDVFIGGEGNPGGEGKQIADSVFQISKILFG